ncbi:MAG: MauE/DoxX family redox-associated membrane protein [Jatrophihabitans sp.]|uniref:MauE/DoxX family redox-associated membrane protein n=1 Tax=Jatrophihabitans sp. TaxID=1932789 RepID=UPI003F7F2F0E
MTLDRLRPWLGTLARLVLGVVLVWSSLSKLRVPRTFTQAVRAYDVTPDWASYAVGYGVPVLELVLGVLLVLGIATRLLASAAVVMFVLFLVALIQAAARGLDVRVGWFNIGGLTNGSSHYFLHILGALGLFVLAAYLVLFPASRISVDKYLARNDYVEPPSAKRLRTPEGRKKYVAAVEAKRKEARSRSLYLNGSLGLILALIFFIGIGVQGGRAKISGAVSTLFAAPTNGIVSGTKAAATVDLFEDYASPQARAFNQAVASTLAADVKANTAQVRYHPVAFLDADSKGDRWSSRAANAAICATDVSVDKFVALNNLFFGSAGGKQVQPPVGSSGPSLSDIAGYGTTIGLTKAQVATFRTCVRDEQHLGVVEAITQRASQRGYTAGLTVLVNGRSVAASLSAVKAAIAEAGLHGPKPTPAPPSSSAPAPSSSASSSVAPSPSTSSSKPAVKPSSSAAKKPAAKTSSAAKKK